jgi:hypothetical protein
MSVNDPKRTFFSNIYYPKTTNLCEYSPLASVYVNGGVYAFIIKKFFSPLITRKNLSYDLRGNTMAMKTMFYYLILASMFLNFIVVAYQINKKQSWLVVSFSGTSIILQGLAMRAIAYA